MASAKKLKRTERKQSFYLAISTISVIAFLVFWELIVRFEVVSPHLLASPTQVITLFIDKLSNPNPDGTIIWGHIGLSLEEAVIGYVLALLIGIPLGLAMGWFSTFDGLVRPIF